VKYPRDKKIFLKVDWNIPSLTETDRIEQTLPTIQKLLKNKNIVIVATHWGRPDGKVDSEYSTEKMIPVLAKLLKKSKIDAEIVFVDQVTNFDAARNTINSCGIKKSTIVILENTRFLADEQTKDIKKRRALATKYAALADEMIDEAFALSHRKEATNTEIKILLGNSVGKEYQTEIEELDVLKINPDRPYYMIMGGAKLETKLPMIERLLPKVDRLFIGGQLVFTFLAAKGVWAHDSLVEESFVQKAKKLLDKYGTKIVLAEVEYAQVDGKKVGVDVSVEFIHKVAVACKSGGTVFWNGPMGWIEKGYVNGNQSLAYTLATSDMYIVVGGGDTVGSISPEILETFDYVSTGGGATLEYLAS
jgi:phosphoglycerate kinase